MRVYGWTFCRGFWRTSFFFWLLTLMDSPISLDPLAPSIWATTILLYLLNTLINDCARISRAQACHWKNLFRMLWQSKMMAPKQAALLHYINSHNSPTFCGILYFFDGSTQSTVMTMDDPLKEVNTSTTSFLFGPLMISFWLGMVPGATDRLHNMG